MAMGGIQLLNDLLWIATITFISAFISTFFFTWLRSKKNNIPMWGAATKRLFWNTAIPIAVGAIFLIRMMQLGEYALVAPGCLVFYGLALVNASKYTLGEIRYLGYGQLVLGICQLVECQLRPLVLGLGFWYTAHHLWNMDVV